MSFTTGTFPGVRIVDMPDLGALNDTSSVVGERAGSGRFSAVAIANYVSAYAQQWSVKTRGAKGDGTTDDTAAIQAAANAAAPHGTIIFPAGTYRTTVSISVPPGVSIVGVGPASIIAPATAGQAAFDLINAVITNEDAVIQTLQIAPTADNCIGIRAVFCRYLTVQNIAFTGCHGNSIDFDRCEYYTISDCWVRSSMAFPGGTVRCQSSVWNTVSGGFLGGNGSIDRVRFTPLSNDSPYGISEPCVHLISQPTTSVTRCSLAWGAWGFGPIDFIVLQNQCQGNVISGNVALGVRNGITLEPGTMANSAMPAYVTIVDNVIDSFGGEAIGVFATAAKPTTSNVVNDNALTEPQATITAAAIAAAGSGYAVGNFLFGPTQPPDKEGAQIILKVVSVGGGGGITGVEIYNAGLTTTPAANPVTFTGGSGSGAQFNLTYTQVGSCVFLQHMANSTVTGNVLLSYGDLAGYGVSLESVTNTTITDNHITNLQNGIYCLDAACVQLLVGHNFVDAALDFGGTPPTFSIFQDNIGVPWVTTTPAMPASGVVVTNTTPYIQQVFIGGGTVTAINYMGSPMAANTTGQPIILTIQRQHTISITYSVAPTWVWVPLS